MSIRIPYDTMKETARRLRENRELGVPADERVWEQVCAIASGDLSVEEIACVCR